MSSSDAAGRPRIRVGLVGRDIGGSRSPWLHEREGQAQGLDLSYRLFDFAASGEDESALGPRLAALEAEGYAGVNVTFPFKQSVIPLLDELAPGAARVGAVNTVCFTGGRRVGHNTDVTGFAASLRAGLSGAPLGTVLQVGAGGGGAATAQALLDFGVGRLWIADRDPARADALVRKLCRAFGDGRAEVVADPDVMLPEACGLVNATPVGMQGKPGTPVDVTRLRPEQWVTDIVYFPLETALLRAARDRGCRTLDGGGMAVGQAAEAFRLFTGRTPDHARMRDSFLRFGQSVTPDCAPGGLPP